MQSLGIDLSTDPKKVWICEIDWTQSPPQLVALDRATDLPDPRLPDLGDGDRPSVRDQPGLVAALVERLVAFDPGPGRAAGIDAPFGWPVSFVDAISNWEAGDLEGFRKRVELRLRATDRFVQATTGVTPLSVSVDRIGSTAMVCAEVLSRLARRRDEPRIDRARGLGGLAEVYPMAALRMWTTDEGRALTSAGYKTDVLLREPLVAEVAGLRFPLAEPQVAHEPFQLEGLGLAGVAVPPQFRQQLLDFDDAFDAFLCALIARGIMVEQCLSIDRPVDAAEMFVRERTSIPGKALLERAERAQALQIEAAECADAEGWIHVPVAGPMRAAVGLASEQLAA